ncbi:MAG: DUF2975 domain-containing protein [Clostridia bacterium]|nr:DUF2975 domain-containing protein [Clostridia bacterium]
MFKISTKLSIMISIILAIIFLIGCILIATDLPRITNALINVDDGIGNRENITLGGRIFVHILAYAVLLDVAFADIMLLFLLMRVKNSLVFTAISVSLIRGVSWCCMALGLFFGLLGIYFQLSFIVAFAGLFLGICLRVTKNVIEEATIIKSENDLTV